jgi:hypothetical protein
MYFWITNNVMPSLIGVGIVAVGLAVYYLADYLSKNKDKSKLIHHPKAPVQ